MNVGHLTDRMPDVAGQASAWSREEATHLASCGDCAAEWRLVSLAQSDRAPAPTIDTAALTDLTLRRLRSDSPSADGRKVRLVRTARVSRWRPLIGLAAAAAVVLAVALTRSEPTSPVTASGPVSSPTMLPELDGLLQEELEVLLASIETDQVAEEPMGPLPRLGDLTDTELEVLLKEVEG